MIAVSLTLFCISVDLQNALFIYSICINYAIVHETPTKFIRPLTLAMLNESEPFHTNVNSSKTEDTAPM